MIDRPEILRWLREEDPDKLQTLWQRADQTRQSTVGDAVHLRGLLEISNHCTRRCGYCGLRAPNRIERYRMTLDEIIDGAKLASNLGYGTVVLQAGEDPTLSVDFITKVIQSIKEFSKLAITLSLGERPEDHLAAWRAAGADRYLLRFETSDRRLYNLIHPPLRDQPLDRIEMLRTLIRIGFETGSGVMIGIPGQSYDSLADDILLFRDLDLDMIGVGPYLAHPATPLGLGIWSNPLEAAQQVPATELMVYKVIALTRLVCPNSNIPSTSALATINKKSGREQGLMRGANVVMPNLTPLRYRAMYQIYPAKACIDESPADCDHCLKRRLQSIGRYPGAGPGSRKAPPSQGQPAKQNAPESEPHSSPNKKVRLPVFKAVS